MNVAPGRYILGVASLAVVCAAMALAAVALRRRLLPEWTGAPARLAETLIGVSVLIAILEALGTLGLFRLAAIVAVCAVAGTAAAWELSRTRVGRRRAAAPTGVIAVGVAVVAGALVAAAWAPPILDSYDL